MVFSMRYWKRVASALGAAALAGCAAAPSPLQIREAGVAQGVLSARLEWQASDVVLDALDHGIVLDFVVDLRAFGPARLGWRPTVARAARHIELRYFPLSSRYQLRDLDRGETRSYAARRLLIDALEDLRLDLPAGWAPAGAHGYSLRIELDRDRLPGALRLPALLQSDWHLSSGDYSWPATDAG